MTYLCHARGGHTSHSSDLLSSHRITRHTQALRTLTGWVALLALCGVCLAAPGGSPAVRKQQARTQFETAERMREALNGRPENERTRHDYQKVADAYRKVYYVAPASSKADASVMAVAEILAEMGRQFSPSEKDLHAAIGQYEFLRREYPGSKYRIEALFTIGQIYKEDLGDDASAKATFEEFLKRYPHTQLAPKALEALAELNHPKSKKKTEVATRDTSVQPADSDLSAPKKTSPRVTGVRYWSTEGYTRVAIDLDSEVKYESGRVADPDRIFFDLPDTRLVSTLVGKSFDVQDGFLKKIRVAQYQHGSTRVVLEVDDVTEYSAFLLPNPYRLIIDIHGKDTQTATQVAGNAAGGESGKKGAATTPGPPAVDAKSTKRIATSSGPADQKVTNPEQKAPLTNATKAPPSDASASKAVSGSEASTTTGAFKNANGELVMPMKSAPRAPTTVARATKPEISADDADMTATNAAATKSMSQPTSAPTAVTVTPDKKKSSSKKSAKAADSDAPAVHEAVPTAAGDRSLIRALGLKIGRIVIDAGHGGHDTGTIGPNGLLEKDLVLDVALRLGKLLESRLGRGGNLHT